MIGTLRIPDRPRPNPVRLRAAGRGRGGAPRTGVERPPRGRVTATEWATLEGAWVEVRRTVRGRRGRQAVDVRLADAGVVARPQRRLTLEPAMPTTDRRLSGTIRSPEDGHPVAGARV